MVVTMLYNQTSLIQTLMLRTRYDAYVQLMYI